MLAPASIHDSVTMPAILEDGQSLLVLGDGAYHNPAAEQVLAEKHEGLSNYVCIWIDDRKKVLSSVSDSRAPVVATRRA